MYKNCNWHCVLCKMCHANACPKLWGGVSEIPCGHEENPMITTDVTYETGIDEMPHPDFTVIDRLIEVAISDCECGCKIYADPRSNMKVLAHSAVYGCRKSRKDVGQLVNA